MGDSQGVERVGHDLVTNPPPSFPGHFSNYISTFLWGYILSVALVLEKAMATHSSTLAWKIPWMEEPGRLQSMGSLRVRHD